MTPEIKEKLDLFVENYQVAAKAFKWDDALVVRLAAFLYAQDSKSIDCDAIRECLNLIKSNTGVFSAFRDHKTLATLLSFSDNSDVLFTNIKTVYDLLKTAKFHTSDYLVISAYQIAVNSDPSQYSRVVTRAKAFYDEMKKRHRFLTGEDDYISAVMLALSGIDIDAGTERMGQIYNQFKSEFRAEKNSVQMLSQVLVLGDKTEETTQRILELRDALKNQKLRLDTTYSLPLLGLLALSNVDVDTLVNDISDVQAYLREQKGFGKLSIDKEELLIYAAAILLTGYFKASDENLITPMLSASIIGIIIAEITMIMIIMASVVAACVVSD